MLCSQLLETCYQHTILVTLGLISIRRSGNAHQLANGALTDLVTIDQIVEQPLSGP